MKKIAILSIVFAGLAFAACKKDRTCECTRTYTSASGTVTTDPVTSTQIKDIKGGEAKDMCQNNSQVATTGTASTTESWSCKLK
jgi:hypothetical protein